MLSPEDRLRLDLVLTEFECLSILFESSEESFVTYMPLPYAYCFMPAPPLVPWQDSVVELAPPLECSSSIVCNFTGWLDMII